MNSNIKNNEKKHNGNQYLIYFSGHGQRNTAEADIFVVDFISLFSLAVKINEIKFMSNFLPNY